MEILTAILGGGAFGAEVGSLTLNNRNRSDTTSHFFAAPDIARFIPFDQFKKRMDDIIRAMKATPLAPGHEHIFIAGEKEMLKAREHEERGIPLHPSVVDRLKGMAERLDLSFPTAVA